MRTMRMLGVCGLCLALFGGRGSAQNQNGEGEVDPEAVAPVVVVTAGPPATKLETFALTKGAVIVRGSADAGAVQGEDQSSVAVASVEFTNAVTGDKVFGLLVTVRSGRAGDHGAVSYVDEDEIDALAGGLETLAKLDRSGMVMADFEGRYCSRGDLEISNINADGTRVALVRGVQTQPVTGRRTTAAARFPLARLGELRQRILAGRQAIERAKAQS
jgi:hypothetical protein